MKPLLGRKVLCVARFATDTAKKSLGIDAARVPVQ